MWAKVVELLAQKFAGRIATKLVTALAAFLLTHGLLQKSESVEWVETTAGILASALSWWMSTWQHKQHQEQVADALMTPPPTTTGAAGVGMGNTHIGRNKFENK